MNKHSAPLGLVILAALLFQCQNPLAHNAKHQFFRMATLVEVTVATKKTDAQMGPLWDSIDSLLVFWEEHFSQTNPASEIRSLNNRSSQAVVVSKQLGSMVANALAYGDTTNGMFDVTILPIKDLWGLGEQAATRRIPKTDTLASVLKHVDYRKIRVSPARDTIYFADPATRIDAGGFAKGYALIEVARLLERHGWSNYLIAAGDIVGKGKRSDGRPWLIGIEHPRKEGLLATVQLDSGAIFTSGDYQNFWMEGSRRIHHIFNPKTGYSCSANQSVTIASPSPIQAKYLSTGLFCLPADSIVSFVERRGLDCLVVDSAGTVFINKAWKDRVELVVGL